jgi:hypothetical protein
MLQRRNNPLAYLTSIVLVTAGAWILGYAMPPDRIVSAPDFSSAFLTLDIGGALQLALLPAIVVDSVHGSVRLSVDVHRRGQRVGPHGTRWTSA